MDDVRAILAQNGIRIIGTSGNQLIVQDTCSRKKGKLYINADNGLWFCFRCGDSGNIYQLIRRLTGQNIQPVTLKTKEETPVTPCCSVERRDEVFRSIKLPLSEKHIEMLRERGFKKIPNYLECGSAYVSGTTRGVPGFTNDGYLVSLKNGFMIPYLNRNGLIQSYQIRVDEGDPKYFWLSARKYGGAGGSFLHYATDFRCSRDRNVAIVSNFNCRGLKTVAVTEGALKADLFHQLSGGVPTLALPGVQSSKLFEKEINFLKRQGVQQIVNLFDMDYVTNEQVKKASDKLERIIRKSFVYFRPTWNQDFKGIDDYYHHLIHEEGRKVIGFTFDDGTSVFEQKLNKIR